jgi:hypothetical protein
MGRKPHKKTGAAASSPLLDHEFGGIRDTAGAGPRRDNSPVRRHPFGNPLDGFDNFDMVGVRNKPDAITPLQGRLPGHGVTKDRK